MIEVVDDLDPEDELARRNLDVRNVGHLVGVLVVGDPGGWQLLVLLAGLLLDLERGRRDRNGDRALGLRRLGLAEGRELRQGVGHLVALDLADLALALPGEWARCEQRE